jgi:hypothetical protein
VLLYIYFLLVGMRSTTMEKIGVVVVVVRYMMVIVSRLEFFAPVVESHSLPCVDAFHCLA